MRPAIPFVSAFSAIFFVGLLFFNRGEFSFLAWNLFLAAIPFALSISMGFIRGTGSRGRKFLKIAIGAIWFIFYPNAPYMMTDLIHLETAKYTIVRNREFVYNADPALWFDFFIIVLAVLIGIVLGYLSLRMIHAAIGKKNKAIGWLFVAFVAFSSGYGIYLGRFERWNSWGIFMHPEILAKDIFESLNPSTLLLAGILGLLWFLVYSAISGLEHIGKS